jgi:hypothetical protein
MAQLLALARSIIAEHANAILTCTRIGREEQGR